MQYFLGFVCVLLGLVATACTGNFGLPELRGPGPSDDVAIRSASSDELANLPIEHGCTGPSDAIAALGALCTAEGAAIGPSTSISDLGFVLGGAGDGPKVLVYGYLDADGGAVRYSAYLLASFPAETDEGDETYATAQLAQWPDAAPIRGEIASRVSAPRSCGVNLDALGTFEIDSVTVTHRILLATGC